MLNRLESRFADAFGTLELRPGRALLAVSGGIDSLALLHLMHQVAVPMGFDLVVAHADHGLHPESADVGQWVARYADQVQVPIVIGRLELPKEAGEGAARTARHAWLRQVMQEQDAAYLCLGHQREDQAETILMRLLAGSGPAGLAGMAAVSGSLVRPLLGFGREDLAAHLEAIGWEAWEDPANRDARHTRSWLRHEILPLLAARDPSVMEHLIRAGTQAATTRQAWESVLERLPDLELRVTPGAVSFAATPLIGYDSGLAQTLVQAAGRRAGALVGPAAAARVLAMVAGGRSGAWVPLGGGWRAELSFDRVRILPAEPPGAFPVLTVGGGQGGEVRCGHRVLRWRREVAPDRIPRDGWSSWFISGEYTVRPWHAGDQVRPLGGVGSRLAVRCLQDARVPRVERRRWPVLVAADAGPIVWIPGICRAEGAIPPPGSEAMRIDVEPG